MTFVRFKVAFDNGAIKCAAGEVSGEVGKTLAGQLVRSGLAEWAADNVGIDEARKRVGLSPVKRRTRRRDPAGDDQPVVPDPDWEGTGLS